MKVKGGGGGGAGRRRGGNWDHAACAAMLATAEASALPVDVVVLQDTSSNPNPPFTALLQPQQQLPFPTTQPLQPQPPTSEQAAADADADDGADDDADADADDGDADDGVVDGDEIRERNKLADGFYEIEAIRRKRVRKGQLQYLIKWRGWPETANTWEPLDNLQSIADVIETFEEGLRTGKHRKRKRKGTPLSQPKKSKQQRSSAPMYNGTDVEISYADNTLSASPLNCSSFVELPPPQQSVALVPCAENNAHLNNNETAKRVDAENSSCSNVPHQVGERREENEYDPKLSELKATISTTVVNSDKLSVHFQEAKASEVNGPTDGFSKVDCAEPVQSNRSTGAKRRKSGSVKRFKQETQLSEQGGTTNATSRVSVRYGGRVNQSGAENLDYAGGNSGRRNKIDESRSAVTITKIIKPIGYSTSVLNNVQDVLVTFKVLRSDGTEVVVDNKFLKVNNPLLLIDFYEQHLRYNPAL